MSPGARLEGAKGGAHQQEQRKTGHDWPLAGILYSGEYNGGPARIRSIGPQLIGLADEGNIRIIFGKDMTNNRSRNLKRKFMCPRVVILFG